MQFHIFLLPILLLLLFILGVTTESQNDETNDLTKTSKSAQLRNVNKATKPTESAASNSTKYTAITYPKKVLSLKKRPTKTPSSYVTPGAAPNVNNKSKHRKKLEDVTAAFKDLPADDLEFIKELDKQFQLHGDKIKIKVEHDNSTKSEDSKTNSKRTIEGELGYGAQSGHNGYEYARPKFEFYPYSQRDIPADAPGYYPKTSVDIQPSYSYELQPQTYVEQPEAAHGHAAAPEEPAEIVDVPQHSHQQQEQAGYEEPVIVLRIPGPTKYASHLQMLLQQYLEIRAAQYLRILEENEQQHHQYQQQEQYVAQQQAPLEHEQHHQQQHESALEQQTPTEHGYIPPTQELQPPLPTAEIGAHAADNDQGYPPEVAYAHQVAPTPQSVVYPAIDDIYQQYRGHHQELQHQQPAQQSYYLQQQMQSAPASAEQQHYSPPQFLYGQAPTYSQQARGYEGEEGPQQHQQQQHLFFVAMATPYDAQEPAGHHLQQQPIYVDEEQSHGGLPLSENNPRHSHTKVIFTQNAGQHAADDYSNMYQLPSIRPFERHAATQQHQQLQQQHYDIDGAHNLNYDTTSLVHAASETLPSEQTVAITQRPFNYHAHSVKISRGRGRRGNRKRGTASKDSASPSSSKAADAPSTPTTTVDQTDEHLRQIRDYVRDNLGAQMSTAIELKTSKVVKV